MNGFVMQWKYISRCRESKYPLLDVLEQMADFSLGMGDSGLLELYFRKERSQD